MKSTRVVEDNTAGKKRRHSLLEMALPTLGILCTLIGVYSFANRWSAVTGQDGNHEISLPLVPCILLTISAVIHLRSLWKATKT